MTDVAVRLPLQQVRNGPDVPQEKPLENTPVRRVDRRCMTPSLNAQDARLVQEHITWMKLRNLRPATVYQRRRFVTRLAAFVNRPLIEVEEDDLDRWQRDMARLAPRSRLAGISNVTSFYTWAQHFDLRSDNPTRVLIRPQRPKALPHPISEADLELSLASAGERIRAMIVLGAYAGLRAGEIACLDREDVIDGAAEPGLRITGKGGKMRTVPMSPFVVDELRQHGLAGRGPVFPRLDDRRGHNAAWTISHLIADHHHSLGIDETAHALRHRFGTQLYAATKDLRLVQELMGHESPLTTAGYVQWSRTDAIAGVAAIVGKTTARRSVPGAR